MSNATPQNTIVTIPKESLSALPAAHFEGEIIVIDKTEQVEDAINVLRQETVIGFDTETRPSFRKGHLNKVALVQLSTHSKCFLFRINLIGLVQPLIDILEDENILKIGLSTHDDFHNLNKLQTIEPASFIELQNFVKEFRIADNSLTKIYGILFGKRVSKGQRLTNWEAEQLTAAQQHYAALDAKACIQIYDFLKTGAFVPEDSPYLTVQTTDETSQDTSE